MTEQGSEVVLIAPDRSTKYLAAGIKKRPTTIANAKRQQALTFDLDALAPWVR